MKPSLPQDDLLAPARALELKKARRGLEYDRSTAGLLFAKEVPNSEKGGLEYWAKLAKVNLEVSVNKRVTNTAEENLDDVREALGSLADKLGGHNYTDVRREMFHTDDQDVDREHPIASTDTYERAYKLIREPITVPTWEDDAMFAWRAIAGDFPVMLTRLSEPMDKLVVTDEQYRRIAGDDSLDRAMAEGRLYTIDHVALEGLQNGQVDGYDKHLDKPIALYAWTVEGTWAIVGIQTGQDPSEHGFYQPGDGVSWSMAKVSLGCADSHAAGLMGHFGLCHVVIEAVAIAARRCLAGRHPLRKLLNEHTEHTLVVNEITRSSLTPAGGTIDRLMAPTLEDSLALTRRAVEGFRVMESSPPEDFARRGVDDVDALPLYPYRDDQLRLWGAISEWVEAYVRTYYADDSAVSGDTELADFIAELEDPELGGLAGIGAIETVDRLVHLMQRIVFRCSAFHAAINYALYDNGYAPLEPTAQYGPGPTGDDSQDDFLRMLPPYYLAYEVIESYYVLQIRVNRLGEYDHIRDPALSEALATYQARLEAIEAEIERDNEARPAPYTFSIPSRVSNSIHV